MTIVHNLHTPGTMLRSCTQVRGLARQVSSSCIAVGLAAQACTSSFDSRLGYSDDRPPSSCAWTWNLNGGVQPGAGATLEATTALLTQLPRCDLMVFTEVQPGWANDIQQTLLGEQPSLEFHLGSTGSNQRVMLAWDTRRYQAGSPNEVELVGTDGRGRAPLLLPLWDRVTEMELLVTGVHLRAGDDGQLDRELEALTALLAGRQTNLLLMGDLNAGCRTRSGGGLDDCAISFRLFVQDTPLFLVDTNPSGSTLCRYSEGGPVPDMLLASGGWIYDTREMTEIDEVDWCSTMGQGAHRPLGYTIIYPYPPL
jgi:hypothetical protein